MRKIFTLALLCVVTVSLSAQSSKVADEIKKLEQDFAHASVKDGAAAVDKYEAEDVIDTDPTGNVTTKAQDKQAYASGDLKFESIEPTDMQVIVNGDTAIAAGVVTVKGAFKQQDISGKYRFTDTWMKRNGKWQVAATQATKIAQ
jgi:ketosteroid isomerase-like protein